jgi:hypothetical protein
MNQKPAQSNQLEPKILDALKTYMLHFVFVLSLIKFREYEEDFRPIVLCEI